MRSVARESADHRRELVDDVRADADERDPVLLAAAFQLLADAVDRADEDVRVLEDDVGREPDGVAQLLGGALRVVGDRGEVPPDVDLELVEAVARSLAYPLDLLASRIAG